MSESNRWAGSSNRAGSPKLTLLELGLWVAGPYAGRILAALGAEVIKVEPPPHGDFSRQYGPPGRPPGALFAYTSRGKESICVDLKSEAGRELVLDLVKRVDVVLQNLSPGTVARLGLDYDAVRAVNPEVIYCSVSGFGQSGPWRHRRAVDGCIQGWAGVSAVMGEPGGDPYMDRCAPVDSITATQAALAILAALHYREATGQGQHIDVAMLDCALAADAYVVPAVLASDGRYCPPRTGRMHHTGTAAVVRARDRFVVVEMHGSGADSEWGRLASAMGRPDLGTDVRFADPPTRARNHQELLASLDDWFSSFPAAHQAIRVVEASEVSAALILSPVEASQHPQLQSRCMVLAGSTGSLPTVAVPSAQPPADASHAEPRLGQHTASVLARLSNHP